MTRYAALGTGPPTPYSGHMLAALLLLCLLCSACDPLIAVQLWPMVEANATGIAAAVIFVGTGELVKTALPARAGESAPSRLFRRTIPWHPVCAGIFLGLVFPGLTPAWVISMASSASAGAAEHVAGAMYFGAWGVGSTWLYAAWHEWRKKG